MRMGDHAHHYVESMDHSSTKGGHMKTLYRILLAMALVASATLFAPTSPAHALLAKRELCLDLNGDGRFDKYECIPIDIIMEKEFDPWVPPIPPECLTCPIRIDIIEDIIRDEVFNPFRDGLQLYSKAIVTEDPERMARLKQEAVEQLLIFSELLGDAKINLGTTGFVDLESGKVYEHPIVTEAGVHLVDAVRSFQQAQYDPAFVEKGMHQLDMMFEQLGRLPLK